MVTPGLRRAELPLSPRQRQGNRAQDNLYLLLIPAWAVLPLPTLTRQGDSFGVSSFPDLSESSEARLRLAMGPKHIIK